MDIGKKSEPSILAEATLEKPGHHNSKPSLAKKVRQMANASKSPRSRSWSPGGVKKPSSPKTPSQKRVQTSPSESEKCKVSIKDVSNDTNMSNVSKVSSNVSGKAKFLHGSTKVS